MTTPCTCESHPDGAVFYVTAINDRKQYVKLSGPYTTHQEALDAQPMVTKWAWDVDPRAPWYSYGTTAIATSTPALGAYERLNKQLQPA